MRWTAAFLAMFLGSGCTHHFLKESTLRSSSTLSNLQTRQVLDNLAMLSCNEAANPCHLNLTAGLVQATDQGNGALAGTITAVPGMSSTSLTPAFSAQRGLVEQWSVNPVVDGGQLETLRLAYRKALDPGDRKTDDDIVDQIVGLCVRFTLLPKKKDTIQMILQYPESHAEAERIEDGLKSEITKLGKQIALMDGYAKEWKNKKTEKSLKLEMQLLELKEKQDYRRSQKHLMHQLMDPEAGVKGPLKSGNMPTVSLTPRKAPQGIARAEASDTALMILTALQAKAAPGYLPPTDLIWETTRNPALVDQAEDQIGRLEDLLTDEKFRSPWIQRGCKKDVPRHACYAGRFKDCGKECHVWVNPEHHAILREFTQIVLTLAANAAQDIPPSMPAFSPNLR